MDNELIVSSIKQLCKSNNITVTQLEKEVRMSQGLISKWKDKTPSLDKIIDIADYFHIPLDEVVGRDINTNDDFFNLLIELTQDKKILWETPSELAISQGIFSTAAKIPEINMSNTYDMKFHSQSIYICVFNDGFITIYSFYKNNKILNPIKLKLFIQPYYDSELIQQEYTHNELLYLWVKILNNLKNVPDEVKAQNFKNDFIKKYQESKKDKMLTVQEIDPFLFPEDMRDI